jgi:hypothetical protein
MIELLSPETKTIDREGKMEFIIKFSLNKPEQAMEYYK